MFKVCLVLFLFASVYSESQVRETETWMPMKTTQTVAISTQSDDIVSSGDSLNGSDFGFTDDDEDSDYYDEDYDADDDDDEDEFSGSGAGESTVSTTKRTKTPEKPDVNDNKIPEVEVEPTIVDDRESIQNGNEIISIRNKANPSYEQPNVVMSHASEESILNKTEVLAGMIAGGVVCLMLAVLLILLLIYRMKKKDEGSYDLGKKPIYKKAPTTEIYA